MNKFDFYPAHNFYVVYFWQEKDSKNWHPVSAHEELESALARASAERMACKQQANGHADDIYVVSVVWLKNVLNFLPFVAHDGQNWKWVNDEGMSHEQRRAAVITAAALVSAAFKYWPAEVGDRPLAWPPTEGIRVYISPYHLKAMLLPGDTGKELGLVIYS